MAFQDFLFAGIPALLSILIPGFLLALPLLKKLKMGVPEALGVGFALGLIIPPFLLMFESFFGILYSYELFLLNTLLLSILGLVLCFTEKVFPLEFKFSLSKDWQWVIVLLFMLFAFYIRLQSAFPTNAGPYFYEFDPYYYTRATQFIVQQGAIPQFDDLAWYPNPTSHRVPPLSNYLGAEWYSIYSGGKPFDLYSLYFAQSIYPPAVAAATVFFAFLLLAEPYGRKMGVIAAGLIAFAPRLIEKLAAGEQEQTPWGVFGAFFFYAAYVLAISRQNRRAAILAGIALASLTLGSKSDVQAYLLMAGYITVQGIIDYLKGRMSWKFLETNAIIIAFGVAAQILLSLFATSPYIPTDIIPLIGALYFYFALWAIADKLSHKREWQVHEKVLLFPVYLIELSKLVDLEADKTNYLALLLGLAVLALFIPQIGPIPAVGQSVLGYVQSAASQAVPNDPLANTVAEEGGTGNDFVAALGPLGTPFKWLFDAGLLSGQNGMILLLLPALAALYLAWYRDSKYSLLFAFMVLPVVWVGLGKIKYVLQLAAAVIIGFVVLLAGFVRLLQETTKDEKRKAFFENGAFAIGCALVLLTAWPSVLLVQASMNPAIYTTSNGEQIVDCNALSPVIQSNGIEFLSGERATALNEAYYLYCSRIPQWWMDPMDWIRNNVPENDRVIHWWDYGHWTNFFGQRKTVTRNDHQYPYLDLQMADLLVSNTPANAAAWMREHQAKYLLLDQDLIGKWGALVYLSCVQNNQTQFIPHQVGTSPCEVQHSFERVYVPLEPTPADVCNIGGANFTLIRAASSIRPAGYCVGNYVQNGQNQLVMAYAENGTQNRGLLLDQGSATLNDGRNYEQFLVIYPPVGQGYEDRAGLAYDSVFYQGFFLGHIDGFEQVYPYQAENAQFGASLPVRIYKLKD
ncbi:Oligosaccharyl transferase STT3 subunit [Candidatus Burarchaeum australiense]|nr:Oligosaccharyl transferase STT3 subunit [Candidatus Burarchaeum australiense]